MSKLREIIEAAEFEFSREVRGHKHGRQYHRIEVICPCGNVEAIQAHPEISEEWMIAGLKRHLMQFGTEPSKYSGIPLK